MEDNKLKFEFSKMVSHLSYILYSANNNSAVWQDFDIKSDLLSFKSPSQVRLPVYSLNMLLKWESEADVWLPNWQLLVWLWFVSPGFINTRARGRQGAKGWHHYRDRRTVRILLSETIEREKRERDEFREFFGNQNISPFLTAAASKMARAPWC